MLTVKVHTSSLTSLRVKDGQSIRGLAGKADVSASYLSRIERGRVIPGVAVLKRLADALGVPLSAIVSIDVDLDGPVAHAI